MDRDNFIAQMWPHAARVGAEIGVDPRVIIAQAAQETGWGKHAPGNNYFGIKSHGKSGGNTFATNEVINGQTVRINDSFRGYDGMGDSVEGYGRFLTENPRYRPMLAASGDINAQIDALGKSGYATDPNYANSVRSIARGIDPSGISASGGAQGILGSHGNDTLSSKGQNVGILDAITGRAPSPMVDEKPKRFGERLRESAADGSLWDGLAVAANTLRHRPDQDLDRLTAVRQAKREETATVNRTAQWLDDNGRSDLGDAVRRRLISGREAYAFATQQPERTKGIEIDGQLVNPYTGEVMGDFRSPDGEGTTEYGLNPQFGVDADGNPVMLQVGKDGTATQTAMPEGVQISREPIKIDAGTQWILLDPITREPIGTIPKNIGEAAAEQARGAEEGKRGVEAEWNAPNAVAQANNAIALIDEITGDPALPGITGMVQGRMPPLTQGGTDLFVKIEQLQGKTFLEAFETLKGGGQITQIEGEKAQNAIARLNRAQSHEAYVAALNDLRSVLQAGIARTEAAAPGVAPVTVEPLDDDPLGLF